MRSISICCADTWGISFPLHAHWCSVTLYRKETQKDAADKFGERSKKISWQTIIFHYVALFWGGLLRFLSAAVVDQQSAQQLPQFHTPPNFLLRCFDCESPCGKNCIQRTFTDEQHRFTQLRSRRRFGDVICINLQVVWTFI